MNDEAFRLLSVQRLPARLKAEQVAVLLNCHKDDVPVLVVANQLKPLGNLPPNTVKLFATADILELAKSRAKLAKITQTIYLHWQRKNARKKGVASGAESDEPEAELFLGLDSSLDPVHDNSRPQMARNPAGGSLM